MLVCSVDDSRFTTVGPIILVSYNDLTTLKDGSQYSIRIIMNTDTRF